MAIEMPLLQTDDASAGKSSFCALRLFDHDNLLMPVFVADERGFDPAIAAVLAMMRRIVNQNMVLDERAARIEESNSKLDQRTASILLRVNSLEARHVAEDNSSIEWKCPICLKNLMHAESFKGHIRKLLPRNISSRPKCRLREDCDRHNVLLSRFEGATFQQRADQFVQSFYDFVRSAIVSSYTVAQSSLYVSAWLQVAVASDARPFPLLPRVSSSDHVKKRRLRDGARGSADDDSD